jgi:hypothetical protein
MFPSSGGHSFRSIRHDLDIASNFCLLSNDTINNTKLFDIARPISLRLLRESSDSVASFLALNPSFRYIPPAFLKTENALSAIMRCRLLLSNPHFNPFRFVYCPFCNGYLPLPSSTLGHIPFCRSPTARKQFAHCDRSLSPFSLPVSLHPHLLLSLPSSPRFIRCTSSLLRVLYFVNFPP